MNLLLLLSALLSALTGVSGGARSAVAPQAVERVAVSLSPAAAVAAQRTARPVQSPAPLIVSAGASIAAPASRDTAPALLTNRRRE